MKTTNIKNIKRINNYIPQFDLGTKPIDLGYQQSPNDVRVGTVDKLAESARPYIEQQKQQQSDNIKSGLTQLGATGYGLYSSGLLSASTAAPAATGALGAQALANQSFTFTTASGAPAFTTTAAKEGLGAASAGSSVASYALPIAGMALGGYGIYSGLKSMDEDVATTSDIRGTAGQNTDYIGDYGYTTKSGIDSGGFMDATRRAQKNSKIATTMSGIGAGASAGALAGSFIPGVGNLLGAGIGALLGGIGGLFGFGKKDDREERMRNMLYAVSDTIKNENAQNKAVAMDKYVNSEFNNRGQADEGKVAGHGMTRYNRGKQAVVETSDGPKLGNINSMVGGGESIVNFNEGTARYIDHGTKRVDNIPSEVQEGDDNTIFGNLPFAGSTFANYAAPYSKYIEEINNTKPNTTDKNTLAVWERESNKAKQPAMDELKLLAKAQEMAHIRKNMKNPQHYWGGKVGKAIGDVFGSIDVPTMFSVIPGIMGMNAAKQQENYYKSQSPTATNSYVANPNEAQAYRLLSQKLSPYNALREVDDVATQEMYGINSAPYSSGQKMAMLSQAFANRAKNASDVRYKYDMANMDLDSKLAASMLQTGESAAQRRQQANQVQQDMYDRAVARRLKGIETGRAGYVSNLMSMYNNMLNNYWTNKNIGLYNQKLTNDKLALLASLGK